MNNKDVIVYSVNRYFKEDVSINIQNGTVVVNAPWFFSNSKIRKIIEEKKSIILNKIKEYQKENAKAYIRNEIVKVLGKDCKVTINYKNLKKPTLTLEGRNLIICLPNKYKKITDRDEILVKLIEKLYEKIAEEEIEGVMEKVRNILKIAPEDYTIERINERIIEEVPDKLTMEELEQYNYHKRNYIKNRILIN